MWELMQFAQVDDRLYGRRSNLATTGSVRIPNVTSDLRLGIPDTSLAGEHLAIALRGKRNFPIPSQRASDSVVYDRVSGTRTRTNTE